MNPDNTTTRTKSDAAQNKVAERLASQQPPPYHTFDCRGEQFVYVTSSRRFFRVDQPTRQFLDLCRTGSIENAAEQMRQSGFFPSEVVTSVACEVALLAEHGLFDAADHAIRTNRLERDLSQRYATPWNKLELALAETCNLACKYCYCGTCRDLVPNQGLMSESVARQAITWLFAMSGREKEVSITFFGGEPLMNKPVLRFAIEYSQRLAKLHGKKVYYSMTTNGALLDDDVIGHIKRHNFGLMVSLDGPPEIHDSQCPTRGGGSSFGQVTAGIRKLMARRRAVTVRCTMAHPAPRMMELIRYFEDFGFTRIVLGRASNPMHPSPLDFTESDDADCELQMQEELIPWLLDKLARGEKPKYFPFASFIAEQEKAETPPPPGPFRCGACRGTSTVGADGTLYPCHRFVGVPAWRIGHIADGPDLEKCKLFWRGYRAAIARDCESCWAWGQCKGPCPWDIARTDGTFHLPAGYCDSIKRYFELGAYVYARKMDMEGNRFRPPDAQQEQSKGTPTASDKLTCSGEAHNECK